MKKTTIILCFLCLITSCNNDDDANNDATNETECNFQGLSYLDTSNLDQILVAETDISTQFFPNASNGPFGAPGFEINSNVSPNPFFFTTNVITLNQTGDGMLTIGNGTEQIVTVTCQREGTAVGDEVRLDVVIGSVEVEFCVIIDEVL